MTTCIWHPIKACMCPSSDLLFDSMECMRWSMSKLEIKKESEKILTDYLKSSPERVHFENGEFFEMEVTENFAGAFIGNYGQNIRKLRKKYSSKILVSNENGKRYIYISQSPDKMKVIGEVIYAMN